MLFSATMQRKCKYAVLFNFGTTGQIVTYSISHNSLLFCFAQLLLQIFVNYQNQGQFWNLHILSIAKLSLKFKFDQDLPEIIKVKDNVNMFRHTILSVCTMYRHSRLSICVQTFQTLNMCSDIPDCQDVPFRNSIYSSLFRLSRIFQNMTK